MLAGALELQPLQQGKLSSLCGLYSSLNAIQLAVHPHRLNKAQLHRMYVRGIDRLSNRRKLKGALAGGIDENLWFELTSELVAHVNETLQLNLKPAKNLTGTAAKSRRRAIERIKKDLRAGSPVLVCLQGCLNHYSVICGYVGERLILFDSGGLRWVRAGNVGIGENSRFTHRISANSIIAIIDDW